MRAWSNAPGQVWQRRGGGAVSRGLVAFLPLSLSLPSRPSPPPPLPLPALSWHHGRGSLPSHSVRQSPVSRAASERGARSERSPSHTISASVSPRLGALLAFPRCVVHPSVSSSTLSSIVSRVCVCGILAWSLSSGAVVVEVVAARVSCWGSKLECE